MQSDAAKARPATLPGSQSYDDAPFDRQYIVSPFPNWIGLPKKPHNLPAIQSQNNQTLFLSTNDWRCALILLPIRTGGPCAPDVPAYEHGLQHLRPEWENNPTLSKSNLNTRE